MVPPVPSGSATLRDFAIDSEIEITGTGDTIAQVILTLDDFVEGSGSKPAIELDLDNGTDDEIVPTITAGGGGEDMAYLIYEQADGDANDFDLVRAIHCHALPINGANPSKLKALVMLGNTAADTWERQIHQLGWDSTDGQDPASCSLMVIPRGHTHNTANTLNVVIYQATNARMVLSLLGK
jgi:hypothetical protein